MKNIILILSTLLSISLFSQNQAPQISNFSVALEGNTLNIQYDLFDAENDDITVSLHVKNNTESAFSINTQNATGDINTVTQGTGKTIEWNYGTQLTDTSNYTIKLVAEDNGAINIQAIANQVDSNNLKSNLQLIEGIRHRNAGAQHLEITREFIEQQFTNFGLNSTIQEFNFGSYTGKNYIGTKKGTTNDEFIYICDAHYDSTPLTPGADDNGSGVVGFIEAARILSNYNFKKTIKFIGFDLEEEGLKGSKAYVQNNINQNEQIEGVLNFEMIGYYSEEPNTQTWANGFELLYPTQINAIQNDSARGNFIGNFGIASHSNLAVAYENAATNYVPNLKVITFLAPQNWETIAPDLGRSDHSPFWTANYAALNLSGTGNFRNPYYHSPSDTIGTLNFTFMTNVVKAAVATLAEQAEIHNSSFVEQIINTTLLSIDNPSTCDFKILTNLTSNLVQFKAPNCSANYSHFSVYDLNGKQILKNKAFKTNNSLNVKNWKNGLYLLQIEGSNKLWKFVVNH